MTENVVQESRKPPPALLTVKECDERNASLVKALRERAMSAETRAASVEKWRGRMFIALLALVAALVGVKAGWLNWLPHF